MLKKQFVPKGFLYNEENLFLNKRIKILYRRVNKDGRGNLLAGF